MKVLIIALLGVCMKILRKHSCQLLGIAQMWRELHCSGAQSCESRLHSLLAGLQNPCPYLERQ